MKRKKKVSNPILTIEEEIARGLWLGYGYDEGRYPILTNHNSKTGALFLVLNFPRLSCPLNAPCEKLCYCNAGNLHTETCQKNAARNYQSYEKDPKRFWKAILAQLEKEGYPFFRYFEMGDIDSLRFLNGMNWLALQAKNVRFVAYTKQYEILLKWLKQGHKLPANLHIYASEWKLAGGTTWKADKVKELNSFGIPSAIYIPTVEAMEEFTAMGKGHICSCPGCSSCKVCAISNGNIGFVDHQLAKKLKRKK